jgi:transcriptional regulator with XRE-family HTH domain
VNTESETKVAVFLERAIAASGKSQRQIASDSGYTHPNIITMFKQGLTRVPIEAVPRLAEALGVDAVHFLRLCLREYHPAILNVIDSHGMPLLTSSERRLLEKWRSMAASAEPPSL